MSDDTRWGFEDADDWEYENSRRRPGPTEETPEAIIGQDGAGAVTVTVDPTAAPLSVQLAANWRSLADLRVLHANVLEAVNAATMQALVKQIEQPTAVVPDAPAVVDESPITRQDATRLMDAVNADLERFMDQLNSVVDRPVVVESGGRHVTGSAQAGQVTGLTIDPGWANGAGNSEMEGEILEVLKSLHRQSVPSELTKGPRTSAIAELQGLLRDPNTMLRRLGLLP